MSAQKSGRILVLGGGGMLGHKMFQILRAGYPNVSCTVRNRPKGVELFECDAVIEGIDVNEPNAIRNSLDTARPDWVVNCVGVIKQREESKASIPSIRINALLPHEIADVISNWGGRLIHFSTDCVFSGQRGGYREEDGSDAEDLYGRTKYLGETAAENCITLRTSIIGRELKEYHSLLEWFLAKNHGRVKGYRRAIYSGVTTNHLADVVAWLIREHPGLSGLYQVSSSPISKYELLLKLRAAYDLDIEVEPDEEFFCDRSLNGEKFRTATGYSCPSWDELTESLAADETPYSEWRAQ